jgi:hypothetical protein
MGEGGRGKGTEKLECSRKLKFSLRADKFVNWTLIGGKVPTTGEYIYPNLGLLVGWCPSRPREIAIIYKHNIRERSRTLVRDSRARDEGGGSLK